MPLNPETRFTRAKDFESKVADLEFPPEVWSAFSVLEQPANAREIAAALLVPLAAAQQALEALHQAGIIQPKAIGWNEFASRPKVAVPVAARALGDAIVSIRISPAIVRAPAAVSLRIPAAPAPGAASVSGKAPATALSGWKLRPVLNALAESAGGGIPGQLLVYKVFLQIPPELLKASGIESVSSVGPDFVLTDPRLRDTIVEAARAHALVDLAPYFAA